MAQVIRYPYNFCINLLASPVGYVLYCIGWDLCPSYGHEHVLDLELKYSHIFADVRQETNNYVRDYDVHVLLLSLLKYRWIPTFPKHFDLLGELV